jgi:hypothetical protein
VKMRDKLNQRMDALQRLMESNVHLDEPEQVIDCLSKIKFAWSTLSESDREYIECVEYAIETQSSWDV